MSGRAAFRQADVQRLVKGAIAAGMAAGSFKVVVENRTLTLVAAGAVDQVDPAQDVERRMREAFGEDGGD